MTPGGARAFTDWTNVRRARPSFTNHYQPHEPLDDPGYYDLANPGNHAPPGRARAAARHPWLLFPSLLFFSGKRLMEKPVDQFVANPDIDIKFCLDWANENWTRRWDGQENEILIAQQHSPEDDIRFWKDASRYFGDPRYIRIDGRPLFLVYHAALFPDMSATLWRWRKWCVEHEEIIPFLSWCKAFSTRIQPNTVLTRQRSSPIFPALFRPNMKGDYEVEGLAANFAGEIFDYEKMGKFWLSRLSDKYINFPGVFPSWDNTPRRGQKPGCFWQLPAKYENGWPPPAPTPNMSFPHPATLSSSMPGMNGARAPAWSQTKNYGYAWLNATSRALEDGRRPVRRCPSTGNTDLKSCLSATMPVCRARQKSCSTFSAGLRSIHPCKPVLSHSTRAPFQGEYSALFPTLVCPPENLIPASWKNFAEAGPILFSAQYGGGGPRLYPALAAWDAPLHHIRA